MTLPRLSALFALTLIAAARADDPPAPPAPPTMDQNWDDLAKEEPVASRALLRMAATPDATVAFLKDHLKPLTLTADDLDAKVKDLGSDDEAVWKPAFEYLEYFDPRLARDLPALMKDVTDFTARSRLAAILSDLPAESFAGKTVELSATGPDDAYNFRVDHGSMWAEYRVNRLNATRFGTTKKQWTRAIRAIVLLQQIGTPDAQAIASDMASGNEEAVPTKVAKDPNYTRDALPKAGD